jgi:hypothetical protein
MYRVRVSASQRLIAPLAAQRVIAAVFTAVLVTVKSAPNRSASWDLTSRRERTCLQMTAVPGGELVPVIRDALSVQIGSKRAFRCRGPASGQIARRLSAS